MLRHCPYLDNDVHAVPPSGGHTSRVSEHAYNGVVGSARRRMEMRSHSTVVSRAGCSASCASGVTRPGVPIPPLATDLGPRSCSEHIHVHPASGRRATARDEGIGDLLRRAVRDRSRRAADGASPRVPHGNDRCRGLQPGDLRRTGVPARTPARSRRRPPRGPSSGARAVGERDIGDEHARPRSRASCARRGSLASLRRARLPAAPATMPPRRHAVAFPTPYYRWRPHPWHGLEVGQAARRGW